MIYRTRLWGLYVLALIFFILSGLNNLGWLISFSISLLLAINNKFKKEGISKGLILFANFISLFLWCSVSLSWLWGVNSKIFLGCGIYAMVFTLPFFFISHKCCWQELVGFLTSWIILEYLFTVGQLAFPYLALGNILGKYPYLIQWYEYTGVMGGTFWILLIAISICNLLLKKKLSKENILAIVICVVLPIFLSLNIESQWKKKLSGMTTVNALSLHSNFNTYNYKYKVDPARLIQEYYNIFNYSNIYRNIDLIVWPETAITGLHHYNNLDKDSLLLNLKKQLCYRFKACMATGALVCEDLTTKKEVAKQRYYLHLDPSNLSWYVVYNGFLFIDPYRDAIQVRTKQKLVPFEECVPYPRFFSNLKIIIPSLGKFGFTRRDGENTSFADSRKTFRLAPLICYESLFSNFTSEIVRGGANVIAVMLNESWYSQSSLRGANAFNDFSVIRAIENRRSVIRSSNGGVSAIINPLGEMMKCRAGSDAGVIVAKVGLCNSLTFYTRNSNFGLNLAILLLLISLSNNSIRYLLRYLKRTKCNSC